MFTTKDRRSDIKLIDFGLSKDLNVTELDDVSKSKVTGTEAVEDTSGLETKKMTETKTDPPISKNVFKRMSRLSSFVGKNIYVPPPPNMCTSKSHVNAV